MPRIAHGAQVTPEQLDDAQEALARHAAEAGVAFAAAPPPLQRFGFLFPDLQNDQTKLLETSTTTVRNLKLLGRSMKEPRAADPGDSNVPAIYTYFGQFVDHDITLETGSFPNAQELVKNNLAPLSLEKIRDDLKNLRTATLELDSVYGPAAPRLPSNRNKMLIGRVTKVGDRPPGKDDFNDLPRQKKNNHPTLDRAARLGDPRNDENLIISQLHLAFLRAHNRLVDEGKNFEQARRILRQHYQHIVLHDFLRRRVADENVVKDVLDNGNSFYHPEVEPFFLPLEFTAAGFRFGHTMVRNDYDYNLNFSPADLSLLFTFTAFSGQLGFDDAATLPENWIIQWERFITPGGGKNKARKFDTTLAAELFNLQTLEGLREEPADAANLAVRNLLRGYALRLPTGQAVAKAMNLQPLTPAQLRKVAQDSGNTKQPTAMADGGFDTRTPLWYYLLAEAKHHGKGNRLGPVGSRLVAEVLVGLVQRSDDSILRVPNWTPTLPAAHTGAFVLADLLRFARVA
jgi:hypothetical protein